MNDRVVALKDFGGVARLFPLPDVVLFPQVMLPLHIFEPRYRSMTAHALAGDRLIAMALLRPGWEADYEGHPPLHEVACLGEIVADQRLTDGRYNIVLRGLSRARIVAELAPVASYRSARLDLCQEDEAIAPDYEAACRKRLAAIVPGQLTSLGVAADEVSQLLDAGLPLGVLTDLFGFALPLSVESKQELLGELQVRRRIARLLELLQTQNASAEDAAPFPPRFSPN